MNNLAPNKFNKNVYFIRPRIPIERLSGDSRPDAMRRDRECLNELFIFIAASREEDQNIKLNPDLPVIYYAGRNLKARAIFNKNKIKKRNRFNSPASIRISGNKLRFYQTFRNETFMPKTVRTKTKAIEKLKFPVVAKIKSGHSGLGIEKFNGIKDLEASEREYDLYSEYIDFVEEYRAVFVGSQLIEINERVPSETENITIDTKKPDEKVKFVYVVQDIEKVPFKDELSNVAKTLRDKMDMDIYSVDFVLDNKNKIWVLETNTETGLGSAKLAKVYIEVYQQFFKTGLPGWYKDYLENKYIVPGYKMNYSTFKNEISKSKYPINYQDLS